MTELEQLKLWQNKADHIEWHLAHAKEVVKEREADLDECDRHIKGLLLKLKETPNPSEEK